MSEAMTQNLVKHQQEIERIRNNPDLSAEAKRRKIEEASSRAAEESKRLNEQEREALEQAVESAERKVLGISYPERATASEKAMIALSYRDAFDRAERAAASEDPDALLNYLDRAEKHGDTQLADAIYHFSVLRGRSDVAEAYRSSRPTAQSRWERYVEARLEAEDMSSLLMRGIAQSAANRGL